MRESAASSARTLHPRKEGEEMAAGKKEIWVFGDYRNYFQNRVTLQLLSRATDLARKLDAVVCATVFGHGTSEWVGEYIAHGAEKVYLVEDERLAAYSCELTTALMERLARTFSPEIILVGATSFGRDLRLSWSKFHWPPTGSSPSIRRPEARRMSR
mgnify:CR=1 FL=1